MIRGSRSRLTLGLLPVLALLLTIGGVLASVAERRGESIGQVKAADEAAGQYMSDVATFRAQVINELARRRGSHPSELRDVLDRKIPQFPQLPSPAPPGADDSRSYQAAVDASRNGVKPFTDLRAHLDTAAQAQTFVKGASDALQRASLALLSSALVFDTGPLESRTLPQLRAALADVRRLPVPEKGRPAAQAVDAAISRAIDETETMIDKFESGEGHSFDLSEQFAAAETQVKNYAIDVDGDVREAVARLRDAE